jgi:hypothetical protein
MANVSGNLQKHHPNILAHIEAVKRGEVDPSAAHPPVPVHDYWGDLATLTKKMKEAEEAVAAGILPEAYKHSAKPGNWDSKQPMGLMAMLKAEDKARAEKEAAEEEAAAAAAAAEEAAMAKTSGGARKKRQTGKRRRSLRNKRRSSRKQRKQQKQKQMH